MSNFNIQVSDSEVYNISVNTSTADQITRTSSQDKFFLEIEQGTEGTAETTKNIIEITTALDSESDSSSLTIEKANDINLVISTDCIVSHPTISAASSVDNNGSLFIQDILLDSYGHVTGISSAYATGTGIGGGSSNFLDLLDTPSTFVGQAGKYVVVNSGESALEFVSGSISSSDTDAYLTGVSYDSTTHNLVLTTHSGSVTGVLNGIVHSGDNISLLVNDAGYATTGQLSSVSGYLQSQIDGVDTDTNTFVTGIQYNPVDHSLVLIRNSGSVTGILTNVLHSGDNISNLSNDIGYITGYTETDPIFTGSVAYNISSSDTGNWNTAYGWGNHATGGYLISGDNISLLNNNVPYAISGSHIDITGASNVDNTGNVFVQDILMDQYGHVTGIRTAAATGEGADSNYYVTGANFNSGNNHLILTRTDGGTVTGVLSGVVVSGSDYHISVNGTGVSESGRTYVQDILVDSYGHITGIVTATETVVDTNTEYSDGVGLSLSGTVFSIDDTVIQSGDNVSLLNNDAGYISSYTETDPIFTGHVTYNISSGDITNWNASYGWGDHSTSGYATTGYVNSVSGYLQSQIDSLPSDTNTFVTGVSYSSSTHELVLTRNSGSVTGILNDVVHSGDNVSIFVNDSGYINTETDPVFTGSAAYNITTGNISNWNEAYSWGDHSLSGYITGYTETDPIFSASPASGISSGDITNWNEAYGWGDHSTSGYLVSGDNISLLSNDAGYITGYIETGINTFVTSLAFDSGTNNLVLQRNDSVSITGQLDGVLVSGTSYHISVNGTGVDGIGRTYVQDILVDSYGHITGINTATETVVDTNTETLTSLTGDSVNTRLIYIDESGTTNYIPLDWAMDDTNLAYLVSGSVDSSGIATFTRSDATSFTVDFSVLFDDTNLSRITSGNFDTSSGILTLTRELDDTSISVDFDGRYATTGELSSVSGYLQGQIDSVDTNTFVTGISYNSISHELVLTRNSGSVTGILANVAHSGDNISIFVNNSGYINTETDPIFTGSVAYNISSLDTGNWSEAYGWGDHSTVGYITGYTETGLNTFITGIIFNSGTNNLVLQRNDDVNITGFLSGVLVSGTSYHISVNGIGVNQSGRTYVQDILVDNYGHVTGINTATETVVNTNTFVTGVVFNTGDKSLVLSRDGGSATGDLAYIIISGDNISWLNNDAGYLNAESDPIFTGHVTYNITSGDINNWNTSYGWGDHSLSGYATTGQLNAVSGSLQSQIDAIPDDTNTFVTGISYSSSSHELVLTRNSGSVTGVLDNIIHSGDNVSFLNNDAGYISAHPSTDATGSVDNSGRTYIQDLLLDSFGHVTGVTSATETVTDTNTFVTGIAFNSGTNNLVLSHNDDVSITGNLVGVLVSGTEYHTTISAASSSDNTGRTYIQDILLDTYGHITGLATSSETGVEAYYDGTGLTLNGVTFHITGVDTSLLVSTVDNNQLTNSSITINPGTGLTNGGTVSLGGSINIDIDETVVQSGDNVSLLVNDAGYLTSLSGVTVIANTGYFDVISFNVDDESILTKGQISWDDTEGTMDIGLTDNTTIHIGSHRYFRIRNETGGTLYKGQVVYASGVHANGIIEPALYVADGSIREVRFMGLVLEDVSNQSNGYVIDFGHLEDMDLDGSATNYAVGDETWSAGDILYVHPTGAGKLTKVEPKHSISVAIVLDPGNGNGNGRMFARPISYGHISDNHDVDISGLIDNQFLVYNSGADYWQPSSGLYYVDGNLGIGTASPSYKLDVSGTITASGGNSDQWNTAYNWGDHSSSGYATTGQLISTSGYLQSQIDGLPADTNTFVTGLSFNSGNNDLVLIRNDSVSVTGNLQGVLVSGTDYHVATSATVSSNNSGRTYIQDILLDSYGHITGIDTATETVTDTTYTDGSGLSLNGTEFNVNTDNTTIEINTDTLRIKDDGVTSAKIAALDDLLRWEYPNKALDTSTSTLGYMRLYDEAGAYAGLGVSTSNFNIGTSGLINLRFVVNAEDRLVLSTDGCNRLYYNSGCGLDLVKSTDSTDGLHFGDKAYSTSNLYQGIKHLGMTGSSDYMMISEGTNTIISAKSAGHVFIRGGGNYATNEIRVYGGGDGVVVNENGADSNFRVEGNTDTHLVFADAGTDRVGIGTSAPNGKLGIYHTLTKSTAGPSYEYGIHNSANHYTTGNGTNYSWGLTTDIRKHVASGISDNGYVMGADLIAVLSDEGYLAGSYGLRTYAGINNQSDNGTLTVAHGVQSRVINYGQGAANINTAHGVNVYINGDLGSVGNGEITNAYGLYVQTPLNVTTNAYGLYIQAMDSSTTNKYGIWQNGTNDNNYFAGNVGIGTATPAYKLDVSGTFSADSVNVNDEYTFPTTDGSADQVLVTNGSGSVSWQDQTAAGVDISSVDGRLTLETATPISTTDQTAKTTLYFTPYNGNQISLYNGTAWSAKTFTEISLSLSGYTADTNFDIFIYDNGGTLTLESTAWTNGTTRATALTTQDGVYVKSGATTRRYIGTIRTTATTGQCEDSESKRFVWNYYNRVDRSLHAEKVSPHSYTSATKRPWGNITTYGETRYGFVVGVSDTLIRNNHLNLSRYLYVGFGVDSTTVISSSLTYDGETVALHTHSSDYNFYPSIGFHFVQLIEFSDNAYSYSYREDMNGVITC